MYNTLLITEADRKRGKFKSRPHRSLEDAADDYHPRGMARGSSETNIANGMLDVHPQEKTGSKFSLIDKFSDVSKSISDRQHPEKKSKSPFKMFKKNKSREPSPSPKKIQQQQHHPQVPKFQVSGSEYSEDFESETESMGLGVPQGVVPTEFGNMQPGGMKKGIRREASEGSFASEGYEGESDFHELEAKMDIIDEFYYGVRIFPGQDPTNVYIGWVTPGFHNHKSTFDSQKIRHVVVCELDVDYQIRTRFV
jgi:ryanodine receptor 2